MAARRYEISLRVLKTRAPGGHVMFYLFSISTNEIQNHFTLIVFWCERCGDILACEDNMLFSHVKISSFRAKAHLVFHWCLYNKKTSAFFSSSTKTTELLRFLLSIFFQLPIKLSNVYGLQRKHLQNLVNPVITM